MEGRGACGWEMEFNLSGWIVALFRPEIKVNPVRPRSARFPHPCSARSRRKSNHSCRTGGGRGPLIAKT